MCSQKSASFARPSSTVPDSSFHGSPRRTVRNSSSTMSCGPRRPGRSTTPSPRPLGTRESGPLLRPAVGRDPRDPRRPGFCPRPALHPGEPRSSWWIRCAPPRGPRRQAIGRIPDRWDPQERPTPVRGPQPQVGHVGRRRFRADPLPNHLFQRDNFGLDLRRGDHPPDGQTGPPARDIAHSGRSTSSIRCSTQNSASTTATMTCRTSPPPSRVATSM